MVVAGGLVTSHHDAAPVLEFVEAAFDDVVAAIDLGIDPSLTTIGASLSSVSNNAAAESRIGLFKNEAVAKDSCFTTGPLGAIADVEEVTFDWVDWYNNHRLNRLFGNIPSEEYERNY